MTYLGIDCVASAIKVVLVDDRGRALAPGESACRPDHPHPDGVRAGPSRLARGDVFRACADAPEAFAGSLGIGSLQPGVEAAICRRGRGELTPVAGVSDLPGRGGFSVSQRRWGSGKRPGSLYRAGPTTKRQESPI